MQEEITAAIEAVCQQLFGVEVEPELTRPEERFGDYATNVALKLAKQLGNNPSLTLRTAGNPREVAQAIVDKLKHPDIAKAEVAGPGFINLTLSDESLSAMAKNAPTYHSNAYQNQVVVAEYSDPNPFKILHAGHIYTTVVGDAIAQLLETAGATVHRVNYGGDVGLHVGRTMWAIVRELGGEHPEKLDDIPEAGRSAWLSARYVQGNTAYEEDETAKAEIIGLNKRVYQLKASDDHASPFAHIYWTCRTWSYEAFDAFYARLGTHLEKYYPESEIAELGLQTVREHIGPVFEESEGAIVFKGEKYGLHTRVFINSQGLPTYEAKEVGLILQKYEDYHFDRSIVITGNEQQEYMAVALKAIEQFLPELARATTYVPHGMVKLLGGVKMSSRKGNIVTANDVLDITAAANKAAHGQDDERAVLAAVKYAFLKQRIGGDIIYDPAESVSLQGNSGPYLQYAHARARSILGKAQTVNSKQYTVDSLEPAERSLVRKIGEYPEVVDQAVAELMPHHICTYLYELAQAFNSFYEHNRVIGDEREALRLKLVTLYADTLRAGLTLLNIPAPERM